MLLWARQQLRGGRGQQGGKSLSPGYKGVFTSLCVFFNVFKLEYKDKILLKQTQPFY